MKSTSIIVLAAGLLSVGADAIRLVQRDNPAVVGFDIQRRTVQNAAARDRLRRRASQSVQVNLDNEQTLYFANVTMGTPGQKLRLHIDTGSSDLWINSATSRLCRSRGNPCAESGTYNANQSSTYKYVSSDFNISYVDGSGATGDYATDTLNIGDVSLTGLQFGIGYASTSYEGILGIGYTDNEVQVNRNGKDPYPNVPQLMADKRLIQSNAYSLWLNDLDASTGSILFGGVNTEKYHGSLHTMPIATYQGESSPSEFIVAMTGLSYTDTSGNNQSIATGTIAVLLDSGSSLTYVPDRLANVIYNVFNAEYDAQSQAAYVDCALQSSSQTVDFQFSGVTISVPMNEMVLDALSQDGSSLTFNDGTKACLFGISGSGGSTNVLGDTFLRSAYVVYDLANNEISIAQTNFNSTADNIREIGSGANSVPDATGAANPVTVVATQTGGRISSPTTTGTKKGVATTMQAPLGVAAIVSSALCLYAL